MRLFSVYILASKKNGTLYTGVTDDLIRRVMEHKNKINRGFTSKYGIDKLVYFEMHKYVNDAIQREKCIKKWERKWKIELIEQDNKEWRDLFYDLTTEEEIKDIKEFILLREKEKHMDSRFRGNDKGVEVEIKIVKGKE
ncbi:MAG TPA: GIY-YIG nuclease family protein [Ignavibacteria bacterium]